MKATMNLVPGYSIRNRIGGSTLANGCDEQNIHDSPIACLPPEVLSAIFSMLDVPSRLLVTLVCRTWQQVAQRVTKWSDAILVLDRAKLVRLYKSAASPPMQHVTSVRLEQSTSTFTRCHQNRRFIIRDIHLKYFSQSFTHVVALDLSFCHEISNRGLGHLVHMTNLLELSLAYCVKITAMGLPHLATIQKLQVIGCYSLGPGALEIIARTATGLKSLTLDETMLTETVLDLVAQNLVILDEFVIGGQNEIGGILQLRGGSINASELQQRITTNNWEHG